MGVPSFYKWLVQRFPSCNNDIQKIPVITNFYIDMNGLIHTFFSKKTENFQEKFNNLFQYICSLIELVNPTKLLYISIDGVAPKAKMNQQRSRRYNPDRKPNTELMKKMKSIGYTEEEIYDSFQEFDQNTISPGTDFSIYFQQKFSIFINELRKTLREELTIIFSDSSVPGEGEHKIFNYIRHLRLQNDFTDNQNTHCIYGNDADLILLSLMSHEPHCFILRPNWFCQNSENNLALINIEVVREYINKEFIDLISKHQKNLERIVDDFVLLCIFMGNDFLPNIPLMHIHTGGIDELIEAYKQFSKNFIHNYLVDEKGRINLKDFHQFIKLLSLIEKQKVNEVVGGILSKADIYKDNYRKEKFRINSPDYIKYVSHSYLQTMLWVNLYYYNGVPSWDWYYPFHYGPFFSDLENHLSSFEFQNFELGKPHLPFEQLLSILPPWSSYALPSTLGILMENKDSEIIDLYPSKILHDKNEQAFTYMGINLCPFPDGNRIRKVVEKFSSNFGIEEKSKNSFGLNKIVTKNGWISLSIEKDKKEYFEIERSIIKSPISYIKNLKIIAGDSIKYCGNEASKRVQNILKITKDNQQLIDNYLFLQKKRNINF